MLPIRCQRMLQIWRPLSLCGAAVRFALFALLVVILGDRSFSQNTKGLPEVGNGAAPVSRQMLVDATQFGTSTDDMCAKIADACGVLGASGYPLGATIDARGFTGIKVCQASTITTMLSGCVGGSGHNGGVRLDGQQQYHHVHWNQHRQDQLHLREYKLISHRAAHSRGHSVPSPSFPAHSHSAVQD